jgi:hypothetical protein
MTEARLTCANGLVRVWYRLLRVEVAMLRGRAAQL